MDALDAACKRWHQCRTCTRIDHECIPDDTPYLLTYAPDSAAPGCPKPNSWNTDYCCDNAPGHLYGPCNIQNCLCDEELAYQLGTRLVSQINMEYVTNQDGTGFDNINKCTPNGKEGGAGMDHNGQPAGSPSYGTLADWGFECCGTYPHRIPYKNNQNSCCANTDIVPLGVC